MNDGMTLSVLIPTYNYPCVELVEQLNRQISELDVSCEIVVADDASADSDCRLTNAAIGSMPHCRYIELPRNRGRAGIRNHLASYANGRWILFIDCDAQVISPHFLHDYLQATSQAPVVCGGLVHPPQQPSSDVSLRYRYERAADRHRAASQRMQHPYDCFTTFCFLIERDLFMSIGFDEECREYGHEDTLFGEELKDCGVKICHIDNPLMHMGLEDNATFLRKSEVAIEALCRLQQRGFTFYSRLVEKYQALSRWGLHRLLPLSHSIISPLLKRNLLSAKPSLAAFALYKLGYYATILQRR